MFGSKHKFSRLFRYCNFERKNNAIFLEYLEIENFKKNYQDDWVLDASRLSAMCFGFLSSVFA